MDFKDIIKAEVTSGKVPDNPRFPWPSETGRVEIPIHARIDWIFPEPGGEPPLADGMQRVIDDGEMQDVTITPDGPRVAILVRQWHDEPYQGETN